jgi:hypothetical protein
MKLVQGVLWNNKLLFRIICADSWNEYCTINQLHGICGVLNFWLHICVPLSLFVPSERLIWVFHIVDWHRRLFQHVGTYLPNYMVSYLKTTFEFKCADTYGQLQSSFWELHLLHLSILQRSFLVCICPHMLQKLFDPLHRLLSVTVESRIHYF